MGAYTLGQVLDRMKFGEVAIKTEGDFDKQCSIEGYDYLSSGIYFDEDDHGDLNSLEGNEIIIYKDEAAANESAYVILPREAYERIIDRAN